MAVIVASPVTQSGSVISGNIVEIAIVKKRPCYGPSPGHTGTGTVLAVIGLPQPAPRRGRAAKPSLSSTSRARLAPLTLVATGSQGDRSNPLPVPATACLPIL
jgi:hypothetical protein